MGEVSSPEPLGFGMQCPKSKRGCSEGKYSLYMTTDRMLKKRDGVVKEHIANM